MKKAFITGAGGFIGSNLLDRLLHEGQTVVGYDNYSTGQKQFLQKCNRQFGFNFLEGDLLDVGRLKTAMEGCDFVFHFAANADVRFGLQHPGKDLEQNTQGTFNILEAMRANGVSKIAFSSTGSVYGEANVFPTPEDAPFPVQTSLYGASKLAGESLIQAYCEGFGFQSWIFRFVSILGERYTHGHVFDFFKQFNAFIWRGELEKNARYQVVVRFWPIKRLPIAASEIDVHMVLGSQGLGLVHRRLGKIKGIHCETLLGQPDAVAPFSIGQGQCVALS